MKCEGCQAELNPENPVCPQCGALIIQNIEGFGNTMIIERQLKTMIDRHGRRIISNNLRLTALLMDYLPEFDKERGLLINMANAGIMDQLYTEPDHNMAILNAKGIMLGKLFLSESAAEFVIVCFTYMLNIPYISPLRKKEAEEIKAEEEAKKLKIPAIVDEKVFTPIDAARYRLLRNNISIAEGYTMIDKFCFDGFTALKTVQLPSTLLCLGDYAFTDCKRLKTINIPQSLRIIKQGAFNQCSSLTVINIPRGVLAIEDNTFMLCSSLESVEIPDTVGSIGASAFLGCEKLRKLYLPDSIKFIDKDAFANCPELTIRCYENSFVHKYCISNNIKYETVSEGTALSAKINVEG